MLYASNENGSTLKSLQYMQNKALKIKYNMLPNSFTVQGNN